MDKPVLLDCYAAAHGAMVANLDGINDEDALIQPKEGGNCANWIAGHVLSTRGDLLKLLGGKPVLNEEQTRRYGRSSTPVLDDNDPGYLPFTQLAEGIKTSGREILQRLQDIDPQALAAPLSPDAFPAPVENPAVGTMVTLFLFHEGYHAGQLGMFRRIIALEPAIQ